MKCVLYVCVRTHVKMRCRDLCDCSHIIIRDVISAPYYEVLSQRNCDKTRVHIFILFGSSNILILGSLELYPKWHYLSHGALMCQ